MEDMYNPFENSYYCVTEDEFIFTKNDFGFPLAPEPIVKDGSLLLSLKEMFKRD